MYVYSKSIIVEYQKESDAIFTDIILKLNQL